MTSADFKEKGAAGEGYVAPLMEVMKFGKDNVTEILTISEGTDTPEYPDGWN